ncbi:hypothetical protein DEU56DRAFT_896932 [Suillus clintonianus]|uniref:uncharacterized protein n=1 Tax=Suillus clintonianus TaxID=1904413 RepID=UPI001B86A2A8|nr:uncharacterized protein DEU56DRAFT_896932 [Suillus clintonianus]KAG2157264.1 hypothetical protein DEU56DRAFT_896932 [Suillus clintonianus]
MRLHTGSQALVALLLLVHYVEKVAALNWTQCLFDIKMNANATQSLVGLLNGNGDPVSNIDDATAISYSMCTSFCGTRQDFYMSVFSQDFSSWLLPYLALISQLPFGAQYRLDNLMSAVLTIGSPVLSGYSLFITLLNSRWINRRFSQAVDYPNSHLALSIVSNLQQVPLRLHSDRTRFPSLVVLPENDTWWKHFSELVNYTHMWSIASAISIAWVVVAYILSIANSQSDVYTNFAQAGGEATSSMWLWLIPIVVGWLQLSPKCDFNRLQLAYDLADRHGMRTQMEDAPTGTPPASAQGALIITAQEEDVMSPDELLTPPVFNYSRSLQWAYTAETIFLVYKAASEKAKSRTPVNFGSEWVESDDFKSIHPSNRRGSLQEITAYCAQPVRTCRSHWAPGVFTRMALASCASLALQWGTAGGAFIVEWFTPTTGMGCRSFSYLIYGAVSTIIWMMLLISSILTHYSAAYSRQGSSLSARIALAFSHCLRRMGKLLAIANTIWVILTCIIQYSGFYDTCFCNSSMISRGRAAAYVTIIETTAQAALAKAAWIGALVLACDRNAGINVRTGLISNILEEDVVQPLLVSTSAIELSTETVCLLLKIDDYVQAR